MITADDEKYMRMALREAEAAKQADEVPIGAVIVPMPRCKPSHRRHRFSVVNTSPTARFT